jgi:hypothetical protein
MAMTNKVSKYIKDMLASSAISGVLDYTDHDWSQDDPILVSRKQVKIKRHAQNAKLKYEAICEELSWYISEHLFKGDLYNNFHVVLQGIQQTIEQEKNFNNTPAEVLKKPAAKFHIYHPKTCSVPTFDVNDFQKIKSNIPYAEIAKGMLAAITVGKPLLWERVQLLLDINDYIVARASGPDYKNKAAGLFASIDVLEVANHCGMNFSKEQKLSAVKALRLAIINGDGIASLANYKLALNSSTTQDFYQRYANTLLATVASEHRQQLDYNPS